MVQIAISSLQNYLCAAFGICLHINNFFVPQQYLYLRTANIRLWYCKYTFVVPQIYIRGLRI